VHVAPHEDGFALVIPVSVIGESYKPVMAFAEQQLPLINGVAVFSAPRFEQSRSQTKFWESTHPA